MPEKASTVAATTESPLFQRIFLNTFYVGLWIGLSGTVILYNKWILAYYKFAYPITLTLWHMFFSGALAFGCVRGGYVASINMSTESYMRAIVPIGALFAGTLWLGNAAYLYLSVSFIQMLKALMPVAVFGVGCGLGTESYNHTTMLNMVVVTVGVAIASYGEINFVVLGVILQLAAVLTESSRLTLVQILLQKRGLSLNPITTLYYIAPASFVCLLLPWAIFEARPLMADPTVHIDIPIFVSNAAAAFGLNMSVFLLIGKTSALTMNVAGVIKDWMLIALSVLLFHAEVTAINLGGYLLAFGGVCWFNYTKLLKMKAAAAAANPPNTKTVESGESKPLLNRTPVKTTE